ncbi:TIGR01620 family protein [Biformimicrobium ophioploci]|uniref:TIGR01620 family protein n=1 Tax=Biformimicrobium ophioploci TaxID=3036711 RepID=A0ABQ6M1V0_9GAMM|nr:TIGR01620 family protein [Microbulbifer sp. NKW57]GMG88331.1 hypothetical protein MNKW57_26520 [Microbulbifer sp. NKW57]
MDNGSTNNGPRQTRVTSLESSAGPVTGRGSTRIEELGAAEAGEAKPESITAGEALPNTTAFSELRLPTRRLRLLKPLVITGLVLTGVAIAWELVGLYNWASSIHWSLGLVSGLVLAGFSALCAGAIVEYFSAGKPLRQLEKIQESTEAARGTRRREHVSDINSQLKALYRKKQQGALLSGVLKDCPDYFDDSEHVQHLEKVFFEALDQEAMRRVVRHASTSGALVGLSPFATLDVLIALRQSLRLVDDIAQIYGVQPSIVVRWRLFKKALALVAYSGASQYALNEFWPDLVGHSFLSRSAGGLGQGLGASLFMARIGLATIDSCRPVPFSEERRPKLRSVMLQIGKSFRNGKDNDLLKQLLEQARRENERTGTGEAKPEGGKK